jgi:GTP-binding protein
MGSPPRTWRWVGGLGYDPPKFIFRYPASSHTEISPAGPLNVCDSLLHSHGTSMKRPQQMHEYRVLEADFVWGGIDLAAMPIDELPEIAFLGRSNVGKSSLLNRLLQRRSLAVVSSMPGRTQQFNRYKATIQLPTTPARKADIAVTDVPGFGFAKFSQERRDELRKLIVEYVTSREQLKIVCLLTEARRLPEEDEMIVREIVFEAGKELLVVITKLDKLRKNEIPGNIRKIAEEYGLSENELEVSGEAYNIQPLWHRLMSFEG